MEAVGAIVIATLVFLIFFFALGIRGPWTVWWPFFLILLLAVWAAAFWIAPIGPVYWGISWIPLFFIALIFALLIAALGPERYDQTEIPYTETEVTETTRAEHEAATGISMVFWILIIILLIAVIAGYWGVYGNYEMAAVAPIFNPAKIFLQYLSFQLPGMNLKN